MARQDHWVSGCQLGLRDVREGKVGREVGDILQLQGGHDSREPGQQKRDCVNKDKRINWEELSLENTWLRKPGATLSCAQY